MHYRLMTALLLAAGFLGIGSHVAQAQNQQNVGELRLYIQQLEEQVRSLTGQVEQLQFQLRQVQGQAPAGAAGQSTLGAPAIDGTVTGSTLAPVDNSSGAAGAPPVDLGSLSVSADDPLIAPDGAVGAFSGDLNQQVPAPQGWAPQTGVAPQPVQNAAQPGAPLDLSALAGGASSLPAGTFNAQNAGSGLGIQQPQGLQPQNPVTQAAAPASGDPFADYDIAYGSVLNGNYGQAEQQFSGWLSRYPSHERASDARFWLAESQLQQGRHREAANGFLELYRASPDARKAPDSLMKLGVALAALGEQNAACATFREVSTKYPNADPTLKDRTSSEAARAGC